MLTHTYHRKDNFSYHQQEELIGLRSCGINQKPILHRHQFQHQQQPQPQPSSFSTTGYASKMITLDNTRSGVNLSLQSMLPTKPNQILSLYNSKEPFDFHYKKIPSSIDQFQYQQQQTQQQQIQFDQNQNQKQIEEKRQFEIEKQISQPSSPLLLPNIINNNSNDNSNYSNSNNSRSVDQEINNIQQQQQQSFQQDNYNNNSNRYFRFIKKFEKVNIIRKFKTNSRMLFSDIMEYWYPQKDEILFETDQNYLFNDIQSTDSSEFYDDTDFESDIDEANFNKPTISISSPRKPSPSSSSTTTTLLSKTTTTTTTTTTNTTSTLIDNTPITNKKHIDEKVFINEQPTQPQPQPQQQNIQYLQPQPQPQPQSLPKHPEKTNFKKRSAQTPSPCFKSDTLSTTSPTTTAFAKVSTSIDQNNNNNNNNSHSNLGVEEDDKLSTYSNNTINNLTNASSNINNHKNVIYKLVAIFNMICGIVLKDFNFKSQEKYKAKLVIGFCFTIISFIPSWIIFFWLSDINKPAIMAIVALPMAISSLFMLKKTRSIYYPCHILCFTLCFALTVNSYYTGGHQSTIRLLMTEIPIIAALILGRKASLQWSGIVLSIYLIFFAANLKGFEYIDGIPNITIRSHMNFIIDVTIVLITLAFTLCYQYFIDEAHRETKLKNAQLTIAKDAAIEAYQARQEFLATMSHEIRTPLNGLIGMATLLRDSNNLPPEEKQMAKSVKSCGDILLRLVNDILDLSKLEANQMGLEIIPFKIRDLAQQICQVLSGQANERNIYLNFDISEKVPLVLTGDTGRILQILMNLTGNALKFTQSGSVTIIIDLIEDDNEKVSFQEGVYNICFRVKDTGIGVPVEAQQKIFEAFVQADPSDSRKYGGSGLGLYLCAKLVKLMKGEIGVYNNPECIGSTFWFIVPLGHGSESAIDSIAQSADIPYSPNVIKVLIAEDNIINQRVAVKFLEKVGIKAEVASNGNEVLQILEKDHFDLIFMDFQMPILDGLRCSKAIREFERNGKWSQYKSSIFICGLTANTMSTDKKRCFDHGMNHFISKPFQIQQLRGAIDMAIKHKEMSNMLHF
ncbi:hypothetical protein CYY_006284 [Polysphondylium violaceum]|uniref:histidine kinase n=1 Tax=Polysphondylium violaceum TaxID=133409 RepID=A0A8J4PTS3_9MYCE|nr:hypothetical protein CYY_006284 [Polysphondylium violaceum]